MHIVYAGEKVRAEHSEAAPEVECFELIKPMRTLAFPELVRVKLTSHRLKDRVHLQDLISVGLIDNTWLDRFSTELQLRLKELLDNPDGSSTKYDYDCRLNAAILSNDLLPQFVLASGFYLIRLS